jgi:two-component system CheB/CheR fusion protein
MATAKEETQSVNEELSTVNDELKARNQELVRIGSDLANLLRFTPTDASRFTYDGAA